MNIFTWTLTIGIAVAPWLIINVYKKYFVYQPMIGFFPAGKILLAAAVLYPLARFVPEPTIFEDTRTFVQHFIGGGFVSYLYFYYCKKVFRWKLTWLTEIAVLYAFVSSLGTTNELLEFAARSAGIYNLDGSDVWYDLFANTSGTFVAYGLISLIQFVLKFKK